MQSANSLAIFIISIPNHRNVDGLVATVKQSLGISPQLVNALTPENLLCAKSSLHQHAGKIRSISCPEFAAALSHSRARNLAIKQGADWNLFLEDDSEPCIPNLSLEINKCTNVSKNQAIFIHLFPEQNGILKRNQRNDFFQILKMPDYANAYMLNQKALLHLQDITPNSHLYLADWPKFPNSILKLATKTSLFAHPSQQVANSRIEVSRLLFQQRGSSYRKYYLARQYIFKSSAPFFQRFGGNPIASEDLRSFVIP